MTITAPPLASFASVGSARSVGPGAGGATAGLGVRIHGGIIPASLVTHLQAGTLAPAESRAPTSYHLLPSESVRDAAARSWSYLRGAWAAWRDADAARPDGPGSALARDRWLLPLLRELGYGQLPPNGAGATVDDVAYPVSHMWHHVPIHLLGPRVDLDKRNPGVAGAARAPQAMIQDLLNRSEEHLWAILSNGLRLRLLRDSTALVGSANVEFDLEAIFEGELYADWLLLYQLVHQSRLEPRSAESSAADCWLEIWRGEAASVGTRALDRLREGVEAAINDLGTGFLSHPGNAWLVDALRGGDLSRQDYYRALLRLVYRLLFCFVTEDRDLLLRPEERGTRGWAVERERYARYFSTARLRRLSRIRAGGPHGDLWDQVCLVLRGLARDGVDAIAVPGLGGLFDADAAEVIPPGAPDPRAPELLYQARLANADLLTAVNHLTWIRIDGREQPVDFRHLGSEELGSVYESLLELEADVDADERTVTLQTVGGNDRKTTGTYYTPRSLVSALLDSALDPLIDRAAPPSADPVSAEAALLTLTVCDPACGSGGFLVGAARRIAQRLADVRAGNDEPSAADIRHALRDVVGQCLYGVDLNPFAAELAKVSLWLEGVEPGKPLSFFDPRIRVGNSLFGATPALMARGVPDQAFKPLDGDDTKVAARWRKRNAQERKGQDILLAPDRPALDRLADQRRRLIGNAEDIVTWRAQRETWEELQHDPAWLRDRRQADAWCAAFLWPLAERTALAPTSAAVRQLSDPAVLPQTVATLREITDRNRFFHWHLEFPEIFYRSGSPGPDGWTGGFDCVIGNPPWEHIELKEQEFFASRDPDIAQAEGARRKRLIAELEDTDPILYGAYREAKRELDGMRLFASGGRYPLNGRGRVKTDPLFAELFRRLCHPTGRVGIIVPTGIATDATTQHFFKDLVTTRSLTSLHDFENRKKLFEAVDSRFKFCLLTMVGRDQSAEAASFAFFVHDPTQIGANQFTLTPEEITLLNPNTGTCPVFRTRRDAEITLGIYKRIPILIKEGDPNGNPWGISFKQGLFNMTSDSHLFHTRDDLERDGWTLHGNIFHRGDDHMLPLYEAKMIHQYDPRWATYERDGTCRLVTDDEKQDPTFAALPRYWVAREDVETALPTKDETGMLGFRDITNSTNERTVISSTFPSDAAGNNLPIITQDRGVRNCLMGLLNSFPLDFVARLKVGGSHLNFFIAKQLPVPDPDSVNVPAPWDRRVTTADWVDRKVGCLVRERSLTAPSASTLARVELDAACFHIYGLGRNDAAYMLDCFPILKRREVDQFGEFRTKRLVLGVYDAMQQAIDSGVPYESPLDPPPGDGPRHPSPHGVVAEKDDSADRLHHISRNQAAAAGRAVKVLRDPTRSNPGVENGS